MASTYKSYKYQDPFKNNTPGATAKKIAAAAKGKPQPKAKPKKNRFSGMSNAQIKAEYKDMSQADKKKYGMQMHTAAMANRKKGGAKAVSTTTQSTKPAPVQPASTKKVEKKKTKVDFSKIPTDKWVKGNGDGSVRMKRRENQGSIRQRTLDKYIQKPQPKATPPKNPTEGQVWTNPDTKQKMRYQKGEWRKLTITHTFKQAK